MNQKQIETDRVCWNYVDEGCTAAGGVPLLLVHGFPLDHSMWSFQIESFAKRTRVIAPDLPGFGQSSFRYDASEIGMDLIANLLAELLDTIDGDVGTVDFCGLSMGGYVGWQFWRFHRNRLRKLIACDTRAIADSPEVARGRRMMARTIGNDGTASMIEGGFLNKLFGREAISSLNPVVAASEQVILAARTESVAAGQLGMASRPDVTSWLEKIDVPTLMVCGSEDAISPPDEMRTIAEMIPDSEFVEVQNAGHMSPLENPHEFNDRVAKFLLGH